MKLRITRIAKKRDYTIGRLEVWKNGKWKYLCDTKEGAVRHINSDGSYGEKNRDLPIKTAIPPGLYKITMNIISPKFSNYIKYSYARPYRAHMPRLLRVRHFDGVLIQPETFDYNMEGSIVVGSNTIPGRLTDSVPIWHSLMQYYFIPAYKTKESITIRIRSNHEK